MIIFGGSGNPELAAAVAAQLGVRPGASHIERFPDGELTVELLESVRGHELYLVQPTAPPVNDNLVELLAFVDACRRSGADRITAVVPYFGYSRADKRVCRREPITAGMVATILEAVGVERVLTLDLHTPQIEGFFRIPVDTLTAVPVLSKALGADLPAGAVVVAPDAGRVRLATEYAQHLELPLIVLHKQRMSGTETRVTHVVGEVEGRHCLIIDDMISTGGTLLESMEALRGSGAEAAFTVAATHGLLLKEAVDRLVKEGARRVYVSDSLPRASTRKELVVVSIAPLIAEAIRQLSADGSLAALR